MMAELQVPEAPYVWSRTRISFFLGTCIHEFGTLLVMRHRLPHHHMGVAWLHRPRGDTRTAGYSVLIPNEFVSFVTNRHRNLAREQGRDNQVSWQRRAFPLKQRSYCRVNIICSSAMYWWHQRMLASTRGTCLLCSR